MLPLHEGAPVAVPGLRDAGRQQRAGDGCHALHYGLIASKLLLLPILLSLILVLLAQMLRLGHKIFSA